MTDWPQTPLDKEIWLDNLFGRLDFLGERILTLETHVGIVVGGVFTGSDLNSLDDVVIGSKAVGNWVRWDGAYWRNVTTAQLLADLLTVDGPGSNLNADLLDGAQLADIQNEIDSDIATHAGLPNAHHPQVHDILADHTATGAALGIVGLSATDTLAILTPSSSPGAAAAILRTSAAGLLTLEDLSINAGGVLTFANSATITNTAGDMTIQNSATTTDILLIPGSDGNVVIDKGGGSGRITSASGTLIIGATTDLILDPTGNDVLPATGYDINLGGFSQKFLTLHAAELYVQTLVAQDVLATIGGRILVGPTTQLTAFLSSAATSISVKHNNLASGDRVILEGNGQVEFMAITSAPSGAGPYTYTVTRNLDGSGANNWNAGDAVFNTGTTGDGFIDIYSVEGVDPGTVRAGPTIVGNIRTGTTYNQWTPGWAIGNLDGLYGISAYGVALGRSDKEHVTIDETSGIRFWDAAGTTVIGQWDADVITLGVTAGGEYMTMGSAGINLYSNAINVFKLDASGNVTLGQVATNQGNAYWNISNKRLEFRGGTGGTVVQAYIDTTGEIVFGGDKVKLSANGFAVTAQTGYGVTSALKFYNVSSSLIGSLYGSTGGGAHAMGLYSNSVTGENSQLTLEANAPSGSHATASLSVLAGGDYCAVYMQSNTLYITMEPEVRVSDGGAVGSGDLRVFGGLYVGSLANDPPADDIIADGGIYLGRNADPGTGNVAYTGTLKSYKNSTEYTGYAFVPLTTPLTSTSWDGDPKTTANNGFISTIQSVFSVPANVKAVLVRFVIIDGNVGAWASLAPSSTSYIATARVAVANQPIDVSCVVPTSSGGDLYFQCSENIDQVYIQIFGYFI